MPGRAAALLGAWLAVGAPWAGAQGPPVDTTASAWQRFWVRPLASLVVPGSGQAIAGQDRALIYFAAEVYLLARYVALSSEGGSAADQYRDLAFDVARRGFTTVRRDTVFEYYEQMQRFIDSGEFDGDPASAFVPEANPTTYNGAVWLLARRTYWVRADSAPDPASLEYQQALQFYVARAVGPDFRWSWRTAPLEQQAFRQAIHESDNAFRDAQTYIGLLLANHLVSAIDALISSRLAAAAGRPARLETLLRGDGSAVLGVRIAL